MCRRRSERRRLGPLVALVGIVLAMLVGPAAIATVAPTGAAVVQAQEVGEEPGADEAPEDEAPDDEDDAADGGIPDVGISVDSEDPGLSRTVVLLLLLTVGSVAPSLLLLMTSFTRYIVVLGLTKNALGLQTVPPSQVLVGLALFLSLFSMGPVFSQVNEAAVQPFLAGDIEQEEAMELGFEPIRDFMLSQTRDSDLQLFISLSGDDEPANPDEVATTTLMPAFVISELRTAFTIGFVIMVPFVIIDLVAAAVLMSMGMMMLPPMFVSLPLKLLLFVMVDGWALIAESLVASVAGTG